MLVDGTMAMMQILDTAGYDSTIIVSSTENSVLKVAEVIVQPGRVFGHAGPVVPIWYALYPIAFFFFPLPLNPCGLQKEIILYESLQSLHLLSSKFSFHPQVMPSLFCTP